MTDEKDSNKTAEIKSSNVKKSSDKLFNAKSIPKMSSNKSKNRWLVPSILSLLMIITMTAAGWSAYQQYLFNQNWKQQQITINTQLKQQNETLLQAKSNSSLALQSSQKNLNHLNQLKLQNQQFVTSLLSTQERIKALSGRKKQDWMLAEAQYLIKIAQLQLSLQKDKQTAIQLLTAADQRIVELADNSLTLVRDAIAQDISSLNLIIEPDLTGISSQLNAINLQIPQLNLLSFQLNPIKESLQQSKEKQDFSLQQIYKDFLKDFVVIRNHHEAIKPLLAPEQSVNLTSNIQLAIQQAQISLAKGNKKTYQDNINNAIRWIQEYFKNDQSSQKIIEQLILLKDQIIVVNYPNQLKAKKELNIISQQQLYQWLDNQNAPKLNLKVEETKP